MSPKPWLRAHDGWWSVQVRVDGKRRQVKLTKGRESEAEALQRWHKLMSEGDAQAGVTHSQAQTIVGLIDLFLEHLWALAARRVHAGWRRSCGAAAGTSVPDIRGSAKASPSQGIGLILKSLTAPDTNVRRLTVAEARLRPYTPKPRAISSGLEPAHFARRHWQTAATALHGF